MARKQDTGLNALRQQVKRLEKNAARKISRNKANGVQLAKTEFDPRRTGAPIDRYTTKQLNKYAGELSGFISRKNQFVGDAHERPIPKAEWQAYAKAQEAVNAKRLDNFNQIKDITLSTGMTLGESKIAYTPDHPRSGNMSSMATHVPIKRAPSNIANRKALKILTEDMKQRLTPEYDRKELREHRVQLTQMLQFMNDQKMLNDIKSLSITDFNILWNDPGFIAAVAMYYSMVKSQMEGKSKNWAIDVVEDQLAEAKSKIDWVKSHPTPPKGTQPLVKKNSRRKK